MGVCVCVCPVCIQKHKYTCICICPEYVWKNVYKKLLTGVISVKRNLISKGTERRGKNISIFIYSPLFYLMFLPCACINFIINKLDVKNKTDLY